MIAKKYNISESRVIQIYRKEKYFKNIDYSKNIFKYNLSRKLFNVIKINLGMEYLDYPEKFKSMDLTDMFKYRTFGKIMFLELTSKLKEFNIIKDTISDNNV